MSIQHTVQGFEPITFIIASLIPEPLDQDFIAPGS